MAARRKSEELDPAAFVPRRSPLAPTVALLVGFVALAVIGVVTVVVPELTDDGDDEAAQVSEGEPAADGDAPAPPRPPE